MSIDIHRSRVFDITKGLGNRTEQVTSLLRLKNIENIKKAIADFRADFIDSASPAMYVIDIYDDIINVVPGLSSADYTNIYSTLVSIPAGIISVSDLKQKTLAISNTTNNAFKLIEANPSLDIDKKILEYRKVLENTGTQLSRIFSSPVLLLTNTAELGIQEGSPPRKLVFLGKSFTQLVKNTINPTINKIIRKITGDDKLQYGKFRVAGHTAASLGDNGNIRINTPLLFTTLLRLEGAGIFGSTSRYKAEADFVSNVPLFVDNTVSISQNFSPAATVLFDIGMSVLVGMDPKLNEASGRKDERQAALKVIGNKIIPELYEVIKNRAGWLKDNFTGIHGSPNLVEYLAKLVSDSIKGKKTPDIKFKGTKSTRVKTFISIVKPQKLKIGTSKLVPPPRNSSTNKTSTPINSLQVLLNQSLVEQIKRNMGSGSATNVLNLRTGRLAESAQVQRLSQSREGMITAFYTYQKNPYATFSSGGRQESPKSRDPKLLISKSIRELGASLAYNRMRAVLV